MRAVSIRDLRCFFAVLSSLPSYGFSRIVCGAHVDYSTSVEWMMRVLAQCLPSAGILGRSKSSGSTDVTRVYGKEFSRRKLAEIQSAEAKKWSQKGTI
jgi:hypothetical protein